MRSVITSIALPLFYSLFGCQSGEKPNSDAAGLDETSDIHKRPDGKFDVLCDDGRREIASGDDLRHDVVCGGVANANCYYEKDQFIIIDQGNIYKQSVDQQSEFTKVSCGDDLAALYDGDDFIVFNYATKKFYTRFVDDKVANAIVRVNEKIAALYDGDDLVVYSSKKADFDSAFVDNLIPEAKLFMDRSKLMFYDGDDVYSYCEDKGFQQVFAPDHKIPRTSKNHYFLFMSTDGQVFRLSHDSCKLEAM